MLATLILLAGVPKVQEQRCGQLGYAGEQPSRLPLRKKVTVPDKLQNRALRLLNCTASAQLQSSIGKQKTATRASVSVTPATASGAATARDPPARMEKRPVCGGTVRTENPRPWLPAVAPESVEPVRQPQPAIPGGDTKPFPASKGRVHGFWNRLGLKTYKHQGEAAPAHGEAAAPFPAERTSGWE